MCATETPVAGGPPTLPYEVAYADTDAGGIVYHATYVEMAERSRNHALKALGLPVAEMKARFDVLFIVREIRATYHRPSFVGDMLSLSSGIVSATAVRARWRTAIMRDAELICEVEAEIAAIDPTSGGPCLLPEGLIDLLGGAPRLPPARRAPRMRTEA